MSDWIDQLRPASFRGVPFGVISGESRFGRRLAVHEYPFRDKPWAEDLGRKTRPIGLQGFLIADSLVYGGGDVLTQRDRMVAAAETEGAATLVHPTLGELNVSCADLVVVERWDAGRYFELTFNLIESGERLFPSDAGDTATGVEAAAGNVEDAVGADLGTSIQSKLTRAVGIVGPIVQRCEDMAHLAGGLGGDASGLFHLASQLPGNFGRYFNAANAGGLSAGALVRPGATVASLTSLASVSRTAIAVAGRVLATDAARLGGPSVSPADLAGRAQSLVAQVRASAANPSDALRLVGQLARFGR